MSENIMRVKAKKDRYDVTYMAGDDSGFDMMEGALLVLESLDLPINWRRADLGWCMWEKSNKKFGEGDPRCNTVPPETIKAIEETDATIMAAITSKAGVKGFKSAILQMRQLFDLYINLRPAKTLPGIGTPLAKNPDIDIVMFRENTEDLYAAVEFFPLPEEMFSLHKGMERFREGKGEIAVSWRVFSEEGCTRIIRAAFEYAKATGRKTVHCCNKANVIRQTDGMMKRIFLEIEPAGLQRNRRLERLRRHPLRRSLAAHGRPRLRALRQHRAQHGALRAVERLRAEVRAPVQGQPERDDPHLQDDARGLDEAAQKIEKALGEVLVESRPGTLTYDVLRDFRGDPDWEKNAASTIDMAAAIAQKINPEFTGEKLEAAKKKVHEMCAWDEASLVGFDD